MVWVWVLHFPMFSWHPENHRRTPSQPGGSSRKATSIAAWGSGTRTKDGLSWKWPGKALKLMVFRGYPSWKLTVCIYYICIYVNVYVTTNHVGELWFIDAACVPSDKHMSSFKCLQSVVQDNIGRKSAFNNVCYIFTLTCGHPQAAHGKTAQPTHAPSWMTHHSPWDGRKWTIPRKSIGCIAHRPIG